jgi:predicted transglutaminase-like cysteine proteinase
MSSPVGSKAPSRCHRGLAVLTIWLAISLSFAGSFTQSYFTNMDKRFFDRISQTFASPGALRLAETRQQLLKHIAQAQKDELPALGFVNDLFNRVPQVTDATHWGAEDYWATPA